MNRDIESGLRPFRDLLRERWRRVDAVVLLGVPLLLGIVFSLPRTLRRAFAFEYTDPSLLTAFTSTYVHLDVSHLVVNVGAFLLVGGVVYALSVASDCRRRFYAVTATFTLAFPFVLAYLNLAAPRVAIGFGFSGVVMAFVGYLPVALATYLEDHLDMGPTTVVAPALFCAILATVAVLVLRPVVSGNGLLLASAGLGVPVLSSTLWSARDYTRRRGKERSGTRGTVDRDNAGRIRRALAEPGYVELGVVALAVMLAMPFVAFPAGINVGNGTLNRYVHLIGLALGFAVTYATTEIPGACPVDSPESDEWAERRLSQ
jgi:hypothetical protein